MPAYDPDKITYFAETDYRSKRTQFGIRAEDRARHMYVIGKTGMGKSTLLENLAIQDIQNGEGVCFIDPHGGTAETLLDYVPEHRVNDVIYFAPFDQEYPVALNVMEDIGKDKRQLVASGLMGAFKKVWVDAWSARMEYILGNELLALLEYPGSTLLGVNRMLADKEYRDLIVRNVTDPSVRSFWVDEFAKYSDKFATEAGAAIQNKVGQFSANPLIRNIIGQPRSTFDIRKIMDEGKIFIVNLSKGRMGEGNASLIGSMLVTKIYLAAMSRAEVSPDKLKGLPPFYLYVDEFQSFANESFADILSEARKYKLCLTIAHQYIEQMPDEVRAAVFGNVGTMAAFRVGSYDAEVLEKEFSPTFTAEDIVNLGFAQIYLKLMIRGIGSQPFSARTLPRPERPLRTFTNEVIAASRTQFARPRAQVEEEIRKWHEPIPRDPNAPPPPPETKKYAPGMRPSYRPGDDAGRPPRTPGMYGEHAPTARPYAPRTTPPPYAPRSVSVPESFEEQRPTPPSPVISGAIPRELPRPLPPVPHPKEEPAVVARPKEEGKVAPMHRPFQDAFSSAPKELPPTVSRKKEESASLSLLKASPKKDKGPSEENLASLRDVLAAATAGNKPVFSPKENQKEKVKESPPPSSSPHVPREAAPKEVPEDVLKKILEG